MLDTDPRTAQIAATIAGLAPQQAPTKTTRHGVHYVFTLPVGNDHTLDITMTQEAYALLMGDTPGTNGEP